MPFPFEVIESLRYQLSHNPTGFKQFIYTGVIYPITEAHRLGFGQEFVQDGQTAANTWLQSVISYPSSLYTITKRQYLSSLFQIIQCTDMKYTLKQSIEEHTKMEQLIMYNTEVEQYRMNILTQIMKHRNKKTKMKSKL